MKVPIRIVAAAVLAFLAGGARILGAEAKAAASDPLDAALEKRITGKASPADVEIDATWRLDEAARSVRIWGNGVGIWEKSVQFRMTREEVTEVIRMIIDAKFGAMPQPGAKPSAAPAPKSPLQLKGELLVVAGDVRQHLQQVTKGEQSEALGQLVTRILAYTEKIAAKGGVKASSLQDALTKLGDGTLAPEAFSAIVRRQATASTDPGGDSYLLRMRGLRVSDRLMPKGQMPPAPRELTISDADFRKLVGELKGDDLMALPRNTYAKTYTDVTIEVLNFERNIPARPYLDVTAETHGAKQKSFDRMYEAFRSLHEQVQKEGAPGRSGPSAQSPLPPPSSDPPKPVSPAKP